MKKRLLILLSLLSALVLGSCKNQKENITPKDLYYDIERIQVDMAYSPLKEVYDPEPFEQLKADVMAGKADRLDCVFRIQKILNEYKCCHLRLEPNDRGVLFAKRLPFVFYCFGNDNHLYSTTFKYKKYLGWKIVKIGDLPIDEAGDRYVNYSLSPYETAAGEKYDFEQLLTFISLKEAGLVQKNGKVRLTLEAPDGTTKTLNCKATYPSIIKNWVKISPEKENQILRHFDASKKYMVTSSEEKKTVYAQCNSCEVDESYKVQDWFSDIISELNTGKYNTLVFDLRYNPGGDGAFEMALNNELWKNKSELDKYNLAIVATGRTYSCSIRFINFVLMYYPQVVLFGEETGQAIFNYTGYHNGNNLKKLNCHFVFPQQLDDQPELQKRAREVTHSDIHCGVLPDVEVYEKFEDFMKGEDTIYNAIYDYYGGLPRRPAGSSQ